MAYSQTDITNQQVVVATARVGVINAQKAFNDAQAQLQLIQATIQQQNAQAAAAAATAQTSSASGTSASGASS